MRAIDADCGHVGCSHRSSAFRVKEVMRHCQCSERHPVRKIVVTGGPGAGKTAVLELVRRSLCDHVQVVRESAGIVFGGGFPRTTALEARRAAQRAIFYVQRELEAASVGLNAVVLLCDRGTVDGAAYWPGPGELWPAVGTTLETQLARYDAVIHLRTPTANDGYNHQNPLRVESAIEAAAIDARIAVAWSRHPRRYEVSATTDFLDKASRTIELLRTEMPACCQSHLSELGRSPREPYRALPPRSTS
jgi:predicted ATPase